MSDPIGAAAARIAESLAQRAGQGDEAKWHKVPVIRDESGATFGESLVKAINDVSSQQDHAAETLGAFLRGEPVELHQVMAATEEAQLSLQMLIEVRNKFTEAYRTLVNMQA
jgi:flagellar hook-basal body complex protein FliE